MRQRPVRSFFAELPSMEELMGAVNKLKNGKAGGSSGILPEMVKSRCWREEFRTLMLDLVHLQCGEREKGAQGVG